MKIARRTTTTLFAALAVAACSDGRSAENADMDQALNAQGTGSAMSGMEGMPGTPGTGGSAMNEQMHAHLRMMDDAGTDSMQAALPAHRQLVSNMIAQFNTDMRGMGMASDAAWNATVDSLQQDLTRMQGMSATDLQRVMPTHGARVRRLMESHRTMMGAPMR